ncbi:MAG: biopolymer transporter ExbD [Kiloniellales bacterium]|nr:biopolymer transporter ExbD [Kiloniellales bacterium]
MISLTPLIDVVFILLVFFMLASSFLDWRAIDLNAPAQAAAPSASVEGALLVEVRPDSLRLAAERLTLGALTQRIAQRLAVNPDQRVLVKPSRGVALQRTVEVLDRLKAAGVTSMSLIRDGDR